MISLEQHVIGAVLLDARVVPVVEGIVQPSDFGDPRLGTILERMTAMFHAGEPVDVLTVSERLAAWEVQGVTTADLFEWSGAVQITANIDYYAQKVADDAVRRELVKVAANIQQSAEGDPGQTIRDASKALDGLSERHSPQTVARWTVSDLMQVDTSHNWLVPGLLEHRDRLMLTGGEGLGKSLFLQQFAFGLAAGWHPLRQFVDVEPRRVLVLDAENSERQWARRAHSFSQRIQGRDTEDRLQVANLRRVDLVNGRDLAMVHKLIDDAKPDVIVVGPLYRLVPRAIQTDDEATPLLAALDTLRDDGAALLIEAHAGKATEGLGGRRNFAPRGSSALLGWPEYGFGLAPRNDWDRPDELEVDFRPWRGQREERDWPHALARSKGSGWPWMPIPWAEGEGPNRRQMMQGEQR